MEGQNQSLTRSRKGTHKALLDPSRLSSTITTQEREDMELAAYNMLVLNLSDNVLR